MNLNDKGTLIFNYENEIISILANYCWLTQQIDDFPAEVFITWLANICQQFRHFLPGLKQNLFALAHLEFFFGNLIRKIEYKLDKYL